MLAILLRDQQVTTTTNQICVKNEETEQVNQLRLVSAEAVKVVRFRSASKTKSCKVVSS
jgi:hypothetical protein